MKKVLLPHRTFHRSLWPHGVVILILLFSFIEAHAERIFFAGYKGGFYIRSEEEGGMELRLGGAFQADYRYYAEEQRADDRFDIRRARLRFNGQLTRYVRFGMEYEFQGNETDNLVDAWGEAGSQTTALRFGQFKEPFSLEWQSADKAQLFAERSMGYFLGPRRDIGLMLHGSLFDTSVHYAMGLFNGDGDDGSTAGAEHDEPEIACRIAATPFKSISNTLKSLQFGMSGSYAEIDTINVNLRVQSTGMVGTDTHLFILSHNTKFGVIQRVGSRWRLGAEVAWAVGPVLLQGEYIQLKYTDIQAAGANPSEAKFSSWYGSVAYCLTGENPTLADGIVQPIYPLRFFDPEEGTWGALCLAARVEHFSGDAQWINPTANTSVKEADAASIALNWVLFPMCRVILDFTHTELSEPIRVRVLPDGSIDYVDEENVVTLRFSIDF
jgi:phosphate-selective porin OprO and OprP